MDAGGSATQEQLPRNLYRLLTILMSVKARFLAVLEMTT